MEFDIEEQGLRNADNYEEDELDVAYEFSKHVLDEFQNFVKAVVLFGSVARRRRERMQSEGIEGSVSGEDPNDIDLLLVVDDVAFDLTKELVQTYRVIVEKLVRDTSDRLHIITLKFTSFWEYVRTGDPVAVNVLRDGVPLVDTGFFEPLQVLLKRGRIRPSPESVWTYFKKAPMTLQNSQRHVTQAVLDLYWAVIDASHAALMQLNEIPPSPEHVSEMLEEKLVKPGVLEPRHAKTMQKFYDLMKAITTKQAMEIDGATYDDLYDEAEAFVDDIEQFLSE